MTHRERVLAAFNRQPVDRVPFSLWHHFLPHEEQADAMANPSLMETMYEGHLKFVEKVQPDFIKVMCDGLFRYPSEGFVDYKGMEDFDKMVALDRNHPWIQAHVDHAKRIASLRPDAVYIYNIFSPSLCFRLLNGQEAFMSAYATDPDKMSAAFARVGEGVATLIRALMEEGCMDGVYYCVQNQDIEAISDADYDKYFGEVDKKILAMANEINDCNILHICGYDGKNNHVPAWTDYPAKVIHWAVQVEGVSLAEGKKIFGDHCVMGGFGNATTDILNVGTEEEIKAETRRLVTEAGREGLLIAPDCALPFAIDDQHLVWVREALEEMG